MVADAGHDGLAIDLGAANVEMAHAGRPYLQHEGLTPLILAFPKSVESLRETLIKVQGFGGLYLNGIGQDVALTVSFFLISVAREQLGHHINPGTGFKMQGRTKECQRVRPHI